MSKLRVSISIDKDIDKFINALNATPRKLMSQLNRADKDSRKAVVNTLRENIRNFDEPPNSEVYMKWKIEHGFNPTPWQRTNMLLNSITNKTLCFNESKVSSLVGWWSGARYPGYLKEGVYPGRVPKSRKKHLGIPMGQEDDYGYWLGWRVKDTQHLAEVAYWNETGSNKRPARPVVQQTYRGVAPTVINFFRAALLLGAIPKAGDVPF